MKKILLFAFCLFSMNSFAQFKGMERVNDFKPMESSKFNKAIDFSQIKPTLKTKNLTIPKATPTTYFLEYGAYVEGLSYELQKLFAWSHIESQIVIEDNDSVYIPNMLLTSLFGPNAYIVGELNDTKDSIRINNQLLASFPELGYEFYVCKMDYETGEQDLVNSYMLAIDEESGCISSAINEFGYSDDLGLYIANASTHEVLGWYVYCNSLTWFREDYLSQPTTHNYTYVDANGETKNTTIDMIKMEFPGYEYDYVYIKGLMPTYPDTWMYGYIMDEQVIQVGSYQAVNDLVGLSYYSTTYMEYCNMIYTNNSYISESEAMLVSLEAEYNETDKSYNAVILDFCSDMAIDGTPTTTLLNTVEAGNKVVASTEYYDLSGRRIVLDDTTKGMCIKVVKYTDGTSNAIKIMR